MAREVPALAAAARGYLDARRHKVLATIRADGSPRASGIETFFVDGDLWFGSMPASGKARDLERDPRYALHSASEDPPAWTGDAMVSGRAVEVDEARRAAVMAAHGGEHPEGPFHLFRCDIHEVTTVRLGDPPDHLVMESWREGRGLRRSERR
jgi:hypothetical protein